MVRNRGSKGMDRCPLTDPANKTSGRSGLPSNYLSTPLDKFIVSLPPLPFFFSIHHPSQAVTVIIPFSSPQIISKNQSTIN
jgi:hypothetical protein